MTTMDQVHMTQYKTSRTCEELGLEADHLKNLPTNLNGGSESRTLEEILREQRWDSTKHVRCRSLAGHLSPSVSLPKVEALPTVLQRLCRPPIFQAGTSITSKRRRVLEAPETPPSPGRCNRKPRPVEGSRREETGRWVCPN